ncbi:MAG: J domain-containing protein [Polyangiaceae bacterium]|nr:J domain-containing protein [Polyangiaceae bacterium]MCE7891098.1 J domain-containing protein [Sorangiineae bacterium PRO1]MCL4750023.1 DnaJ domain-containing protein [Myxococcales bacterium]
MHDYYQLLGVSPLASKKEIARAYRRRAVSRHRSELLQLKDELELMQEAFETLSDPDRRRDYDLQRELALSPADREEEARIRREGRLRAKYAREIGRTAQKLGEQSVAAHAGMMQAIGDEHDRREARETRLRRMRDVLRMALLVLVLLATAAWFLLSR